MAAIRFVDTFTDTDNTNLQSHTSDSGHTWTKMAVINGATQNPAKVVSNAVKNTYSGGGEFYYASWAPQTADYSVFGDLTWKGTPASDIYVAIMSRQPAANENTHIRLLAFAAQSGSNPQFQLAVIDTGTNKSWTSVSAGTDTSGVLSWTASNNPSSGYSYKCELRCIGSTIEAYIDGTLRLGGVNTNLSAAGRLGLEVYGESGSTAMTIDNMYGVDYALTKAPASVARQAVNRAATR